MDAFPHGIIEGYGPRQPHQPQQPHQPRQPRRRPRALSSRLRLANPSLPSPPIASLASHCLSRASLSSPGQVTGFLRALGLSEWADIFLTHRIQGDVMFSLTEPTLAEMGVAKIGDRLYLVDCLQSLYEELTAWKQVRPSGPAGERPSARAPERTSGRADERTSARADERTSGRADERTSGRAGEWAGTRTAGTRTRQAERAGARTQTRPARTHTRPARTRTTCATAHTLHGAHAVHGAHAHLRTAPLWLSAPCTSHNARCIRRAPHASPAPVPQSVSAI